MTITQKQAITLIQQLHVLLVEDSPYIRSIVRGMLTIIGVHCVTEADDGIDALGKMRKDAPDAAIVDIHLGKYYGPVPRMMTEEPSDPAPSAV
jgi:CheY-like chemotaxis protein